MATHRAIALDMENGTLHILRGEDGAVEIHVVTDGLKVNITIPREDVLEVASFLWERD